MGDGKENLLRPPPLTGRNLPASMRTVTGANTSGIPAAAAGVQSRTVGPRWRGVRSTLPGRSSTNAPVRVRSLQRTSKLCESRRSSWVMSNHVSSKTAS